MLANFDGLVGLTHNYSGLSFGNVASTQNKSLTSHPKKAALQGLEKMLFIKNLGASQGFIPPQIRPDIDTLKRLGFKGTAEDIIKKAAAIAPHLLMGSSSASSMWCANAATISASSDTEDGKVHITPANLTYYFHRSIESLNTSKILKTIFSDKDFFVHHDPLPSTLSFCDEGAANQIRLFANEKSVTLFVFGRTHEATSSYYPARQTKEAAEALIRQHGLKKGRYFLARQNPEAIDQGVFHNDVIAMGTQNLLILHEKAYYNQKDTLKGLKELFLHTTKKELIVIEIKEKELPLKSAVKSYFFNSQLILTKENHLALIAPKECEPANDFIKGILKPHIEEIHYLNIRESMQNGGGPACLRLPAPLKLQEWEKVNKKYLLDEPLYHKLTAWVEKHYRESITPEDLMKPDLYLESLKADLALQELLA